MSTPDAPAPSAPTEAAPLATTSAAAPPAVPASADVFAAWPRSAQLTTAFLLGVVLTLLFVQVLSYQRFGTRPAELDRRYYRIDLNRADRAELLQLPGVGAALANRLEDYRREHGGFHSVEEVTEVPGVGSATLERLRPWIYVSEVDEDTRPSEPRPSKSSSRKTGKKDADLTEPIDVNHASGKELQRLPGIGPKMAQRIIDERQKKPFRSVEELRRVSGIGAKTLEKLRPYVVVQAAGEKLVTENLP